MMINKIIYGSILGGMAFYAMHLGNELGARHKPIKETTQSQKKEVIISDYENIIEDYQAEINRIKSSLPPQDSMLLAKAIDKYGYESVEALAMNGANECPSSNLVSHTWRCDAQEEAAVMYSALNLFKLGENGKTLKKVIYSRTGSNYTFSWVPNPLHRKGSAIYKNSFKMAAHILGGGLDYADSQYGQFYYCNNRTSPCSWHNKSSNLIPLGRIKLYNEGVNVKFIKDHSLSRHHFYTLTPQYLNGRKVS